MITAAFAFVGSMLGSMFMIYILNEPKSNIDDELYQNSGHHGFND